MHKKLIESYIMVVKIAIMLNVVLGELITYIYRTVYYCLMPKCNL